MRRELESLRKSYQEKYPECLPIYSEILFKPEPVPRPFLETLCSNSFYKGYEMAINYSKGIKEFEWDYQKAWSSLESLHINAKEHTDSFQPEDQILAKIRGFCFADGLQKSFQINYEIVLKNGKPTHLYDSRDKRKDQLERLEEMINWLSQKLGKKVEQSELIQTYRKNLQTERNGLRNVTEVKFSSSEVNENSLLRPKDPSLQKVIETTGPRKEEEGIEDHNLQILSAENHENELKDYLNDSKEKVSHQTEKINETIPEINETLMTPEENQKEANQTPNSDIDSVNTQNKISETKEESETNKTSTQESESNENIISPEESLDPILPKIEENTEIQKPKEEKVMIPSPEIETPESQEKIEIEDPIAASDVFLHDSEMKDEDPENEIENQSQNENESESEDDSQSEDSEDINNATLNENGEISVNPESQEDLNITEFD